MIPKSHFNLLLALSLFFLSFLAYIYVTQQYQIQLLQYQLLKLQSPTPPISPTPTATSATSTWKTYENKTYKYSIKYPNTFAIVENSALSENSVSVCKEKDLDTYCVSIYPTKQTETQFLKEKIVKDVAVDNSDVIPEKVKIGNIDATAISIGTAMGFGSRYYFVSKDNTNLIMHTIINDYPEKDRGLNQILSTFKFTQ